MFGVPEVPLHAHERKKNKQNIRIAIGCLSVKVLFLCYGDRRVWVVMQLTCEFNEENEHIKLFYGCNHALNFYYANRCGGRNKKKTNQTDKMTE